MYKKISILRILTIQMNTFNLGEMGAVAEPQAGLELELQAGIAGGAAAKLELQGEQ